MPSPRQEIPSLTSSSSYELLLPIARGGMGAVYVGRLRAAAGFSRLVAIKRAHASALRDPEVRRIVVEEARVASKVHHPHIVAVQAIEELDGELLLIMDYVEGASLARLIEVSNAATPPRGLALGVALRIALDACVGLFAVHEMCDEFGRRLGLTHRDISPQNLLVGVDGVARITDFGIAKSRDRPGRKTTTQVLKGKAAYMAPEYIERGTVDPRIDVFALGVTVWEVLANRRLFRARNAAETIAHVLHMNVPWLADLVPELPEPLAQAVHGALARDPNERFATARAFGDALEEATAGRVRLATHGEVAATVRALEGRTLDARRSELRVLLLGGEATADMPIPGLGPAEPPPARAHGASAAPTGSAATPSAESSTNPLARSAEDTAPTRADGRAASARAAAAAAPPPTPVSAADAEPAGRASSPSL
ncbi:MAG: serine/threonine protein kinase, partial [Myxococcales bacterium]|nr:serine/threonine protein kinase [Myxococcales bacterium]